MSGTPERYQIQVREWPEGTWRTIHAFASHETALHVLVAVSRRVPAVRLVEAGGHVLASISVGDQGLAEAGA